MKNQKHIIIVKTMNKILTSLLSLSFVLFSCEKKQNDFIPLFNGENLDGWEIKNGTAPFTVEDGVIIGTYTSGTPPNTFLCTKKSYGDFILTFESYLGEETNSGVMFRLKVDPNIEMVEYMATKWRWIHLPESGRAVFLTKLEEDGYTIWSETQKQKMLLG